MATTRSQTTVPEKESPRLAEDAILEAATCFLGTTCTSVDVEDLEEEPLAIAQEVLDSELDTCVSKEME